MIRKIAILILCISVFQVSYSQGTSYPKGAYTSFLELKSKKPSMIADFKITLRPGTKISIYGGADYKIKCNETGTDENIKRDVYAVSSDDTLYVNCHMLHISGWYAKVISEGQFLVFWAPIDKIEYKKIIADGRLDADGHFLTSAMLAMIRKLYFIDTSNDFGIAKQINSPILKNILASDEDLLYAYENESDMDNPEIMLKYLLIVNRGY